MVDLCRDWFRRKDQPISFRIRTRHPSPADVGDSVFSERGEVEDRSLRGEINMLKGENRGIKKGS